MSTDLNKALKEVESKLNKETTVKDALIKKRDEQLAKLNADIEQHKTTIATLESRKNKIVKFIKQQEELLASFDEEDEKPSKKAEKKEPEVDSEPVVEEDLSVEPEPISDEEPNVSSENKFGGFFR